MDPQQDWMSEEDLLATITGTTVPTPKMLVGGAFGRVLEKPLKYRKDGAYLAPAKCGDNWIDFWFDTASVERALSVFDPGGVFEVPMVADYDGVKVVAKADQMIGRLIVENKAKLAPSFDFDKYAQSVQWKLMADMAGVDAVRYNVFLLDDSEMLIRLRAIESFNLYPYALMHDDCLDIVQQFREYVERKGLVEQLNEKQAYVEARYAREL